MPTAAWFLFLVTVATAISALDDPPIINQSLTAVANNLTFTYDLTSSASNNIINVKFQPRINSHQGQAGPRFSSTVYVYAQVLFNSTGANSPLTFDDITNKLVDGNGFVMMKNQLISIKRSDFTPPLTAGSMAITVFIYASEQNTQVDVMFNLTVSTHSTSKQCPNNCSSNGACDTNSGQCTCNSEDSGYDCSVRQQVLSLKVDSGFYLKGGDIAYAVVPADLTTSTLILNIAKPTDKTCSVVFRMNQESKFNVMSIFEGTGKDLVGSLYQATYQTNPFGRKLYIAINNFGPDDCQVTITVTQQATVSVLLIIMIVLGVAILIALIIGIIYIVRKRREFRVQPREMLAGREPADTNLTPEEIERYFPVVLADKVMMAKSRDDSSMDLVPTQDCVICLCPIEKAEPIRVTYCNHLFHKDCLIGWFKKLQNCPYCRESFNKQHILELYEKVRSFSRKASSNDTLELQGDNLAVQIVEYHRSSKIGGSQEQLLSGKSPRRRINIESLE